jgi:tetrapyrrole methylase family protein/MazG family protein
MTASSGKITIVGLGPGDPASRTLGAQRALDQADQIILRTRIHPGIDDLANDPRVSDCDDLYLAAPAFDVLYPAIAQRVLDRALTGGATVFAVPGHPRFSERVVPLVESGASLLGIPTETLDAVSFVDATTTLVDADPIASGLQIVDAEHLAAIVDAEPFSAGRLGVDPARPLLVAQLYNPDLAAAVKIALSRLYPNEHPVVVVWAAGAGPRQATAEISLHQLDRQAVDELTSLWVPPLSPLDAVRAPEALTRVVARLRAPGGCPWDRAQSHASLRDAVLEEAYETVDAIDTEDAAALAEELGDVLLLVAMHAQLAEESGVFRIEDVYEGITRKLIRRHPHVFGDVSAETPDAVVATWEGVKAAERAAAGESQQPEHPLDRLPRAMPATRKVIEMLAPRATLRAPDDASSGDSLLAAMTEVLDRGIDPERALEAALRRRVTREQVGEVLVAANTGSQSRKGEE